MKIQEYGSNSHRKMILIHGFQSPVRVWEKYIESYRNDFHIIVPVLPGHDPETSEDFISMPETARELENYCIERYGENVHAVFGMSMGGVLAAHIWQNGRLKARKIIFDGSPLAAANGLVKRFMTSFYINVTHRSKQRDRKTLEQAVNICPPEYMEDFLKILDNMSDATVKNCINDIAGYRLPDNINSGAEIYYFHGTSGNEMLAKKSAKLISGNYPNAVIKSFKGLGHCENSLFHPEVMIHELNKIL